MDIQNPKFLLIIIIVLIALYMLYHYMTKSGEEDVHAQTRIVAEELNIPVEGFENSGTNPSPCNQDSCKLKDIKPNIHPITIPEIKKYLQKSISDKKYKNIKNKLLKIFTDEGVDFLDIFCSVSFDENGVPSGGVKIIHDPDENKVMALSTKDPTRKSVVDTGHINNLIMVQLNYILIKYIMSGRTPEERDNKYLVDMTPAILVFFGSPRLKVETLPTSKFHITILDNNDVILTSLSVNENRNISEIPFVNKFDDNNSGKLNLGNYLLEVVKRRSSSNRKKLCNLHNLFSNDKFECPQ